MRRIKNNEESKLYGAQYTEINKVYGKERAELANYGWVTTDYVIATKVYGNLCMIVSSYFIKDRITHKHSKYYR